MKEPEIPYKEIAAYLKGDLSTTDKLWVESWMAASSANAETFEALKEEWKYLDEEHVVDIDKDRVWNLIHEHVLLHPSASNKPFIKRSFVIKVASIAASVALLIGAISSLLIKGSIDTINREQAVTKIETPEGQKMLMTLPDETKVWLNSGSILSYTENFNKSDREISLCGEAFFDVTHSAKKEFIVKTTSVNVVVKGTTFDVSAYDEDPYVGVSLVEGKVDVMDRNNNLLVELAPNENVKVNKSSLQYVHTKNIKDAFPLWTKEQLVFYNVDLFEMTRKIERWYGVEIELINPIISQKYSFSVKTESIRELLELFNKIAPIEYSINGKEVTIRCK